MTPQLATRSPRSRWGVRRFVWVVPAVFLGILVIAVFTRLLQGPDLVDRVTIENTTMFDVDVDVSGSDDRLLNLTHVEARETTTVRDVIDQGDVWVFHFSYGGTNAGTLRLEREELERQGWTVAVPPEVAARLEAAGHEPRQDVRATRP